jgi:hexokinase
MRIDIYHHFDPAPGVLDRLEVLVTKLGLIVQGEEKLMSEITDALDKAEAAAKANSEADDSAEQLITTLSGLVAQLKTQTTDPATATRINALADALTARAAQLGTAVAAAPTA